MTPEQKEWIARPAIGPPKLQPIEGTKWWFFCEDYHVSLPPPFWPIRLFIPKGWVYDRSSIPEWVPSWIINKDDLGTLAPAVHDAGYQTRGLFFTTVAPHRPYAYNERTGDREPLIVKRREVDEWFKLFMLRQRINTTRANMAYRAVSWNWSTAEFLGFSKPW